MKLTCTQDNLAKGLNTVVRLSEKSTNLPILNNVLIEARKDGLVLTTTNLEIGIKTVIRGKIDVEGVFTIPARLITDFVNTLNKENVTLELKENTLHIQGENHKTDVRGVDATDFPVLPDVDNTYTIEIDTNEFKDLLSQTVFAMSGDESRPELNGAFFQFKDATCVVAATDSFRLVEKTIPIKNSNKEKQSCIVPGRTIIEVLRVVDIEENGAVEVSINDNQIKFSIGSTEVISRLVTGNYPDYKQIIPPEFTNSVEFAVSDMVQAIKTTSLFCKQGINDVRISLDKRFADIVVQAENSQHGKNTSQVATVSKGQEMDIVLNYKFFLDGLQHIAEQSVELKTNSATSPALLKPKKDKSLLYVIMPIKQ